uniref:Uncharacterized protein n=1 Tax=Arundo donax TaxID=35708 RepID=A0A0A9BVN3_ARUDO
MAHTKPRRYKRLEYGVCSNLRD